MKMNKRTISFNLDETLINHLKLVAEIKGWSLSYLVNRALWNVYYEVGKEYVDRRWLEFQDGSNNE